MNSQQKFITFLAQKVVHHRNQGAHFRIAAKKWGVVEENLAAAETHELISTIVESWITEIRTGAYK